MERSTLKRRWSCPDPEFAKAMRSTSIMRPKSGSPLLMLSPEDDACRLYNPEENRVYETRSSFSGCRFLANSGKWFLVIDSRSDLYIIDVFSEERIHLPALESMKGGLFKLERLGDNEFSVQTIFVTRQNAQDLRGLLWVDDKNGDYVVVWQFMYDVFLGFCKKGDDHYREITTKKNVSLQLRGHKHLVLRGYDLYVLTSRKFIRHLDLSGEDGFKDVSGPHTLPMWKPGLSKDEYESVRAYKFISTNDNIAVTTSGEVLFVHNRAYESTTLERHRIFQLYKRDPKDLDPKTFFTELVEVDSLGDEALFLDLGITVPADHTLGIEPNTIYFTRDDRFVDKKHSFLDICVYNLATKTTKRFPTLSNLKLKDAQWFFPS